MCAVTDVQTLHQAAFSVPPVARVKRKSFPPQEPPVSVLCPLLRTPHRQMRGDQMSSCKDRDIEGFPDPRPKCSVPKHTWSNQEEGTTSLAVAPPPPHHQDAAQMSSV
ncbi:hypothetical protein H920_15207 [Fukomys damarensis]|uniref:Uncharacterized protein n=1 Tax=Fukomys damarensis TaxID=885580 RepID=A0A091CXJ8_FUKDA|nr:hypothetical protein H920_15207 [Fukomys damarensis]